MRSSVLAPSRARVRARSLTATAALALASAVAGCTAAANSTVSATGNALTIYMSAPAELASDQQSQDVLDAEQLAFAQAPNHVDASTLKVGTFTVKLRRLEDNKLSNNARTAIEDTSAIAYLGEIRPGASADSLGITNAQDLLQVSPTDTALELTLPTAAVPGSPSTYYESLKTFGRTFARVVPNTAQEAKAQVKEMQSLGVRKLYVSDDGSPYGAAIALAVRQDAPSRAITVVSTSTGADAAFYGGSSETSAARTFNSLSQTNPTIKLFGPSALDDNAFTAALGAAKLTVYISVPGFLSKDLTPAAQTFVSDFKHSYQHAPAPQAIFGYEAMSAVIAVIQQAGSAANNRSTVVQRFFAIKDRASVLGTYSIDANGDTSLAPFVFDRLRAGRLVPFTSVLPQG